MTQQVISKKPYFEPKPIQRIRGSPNGYYWVQSEKHPQLWYKTVLLDDHEKIYCACPYFKHKREMCKHLIKIIALEIRVL